MAYINPWLEMMSDLDASDLHIRASQKPCYRVNGNVEIAAESDPIHADSIEHMVHEILKEEQIRRFRDAGELDFSYGLSDGQRFRGKYFVEHRGPAVTFRRIPARVPSFSELNLPDELTEFTELKSGLVLVTGATGSGKTSTLAAMIDLINATYHRHIVTLEDPIEYLYDGQKKSRVHQRGLHEDVVDFQSGIRAALREDVDVLLVGELRDQEAIKLTLRAAECGLLVFATLHTNGAVESINRIIDIFPTDEQSQVRAMLSQSLAGIVSQMLLPRADRPGQIPAVEILVATGAVRSLIREEKTHEIPSLIQSGKAHGMLSLADSLESLVRRGKINADDACHSATR